MIGSPQASDHDTAECMWCDVACCHTHNASQIQNACGTHESPYLGAWRTILAALFYTRCNLWMLVNGAP